MKELPSEHSGICISLVAEVTKRLLHFEGHQGSHLKYQKQNLGLCLLMQ